jgi:hypothetical protein
LPQSSERGRLTHLGGLRQDRDFLRLRLDLGGLTAALQRVFGSMTKFVIDCGVALQLASEGGEIPPNVAVDRLTRVWALPIRLLGDAVLRRRAWDVAEQLGWASTYDAEYVALTQLQADAFVTLDAELARRVEGIVSTATIEALGTA